MCTCEKKVKGSTGRWDVKRKIQLEPSGTSGLCLGITRHPCDKIHVLFVRQPSAAESCKKMGRLRWESDVSRSARRRYFIGSNRNTSDRTTAGTATFLVKVKVHRGEPANEEADIQADKAISGKDVHTEWHDRTNRAVFTWQQPRRKGGTVRYEDRESTWNSKVRKAIRRGSAEEEVRKHRDPVTGAWKQIRKPRRRVDVSYDPSMVTALHHGTWMDEEGFKKTCIKEKKKKGGIRQPLYGTWVAGFMLRQDVGRLMLERYLSDQKSHGSVGDHWGWRWQEIRQQPVF